jgi:hypothetical protein
MGKLKALFCGATIGILTNAIIFGYFDIKANSLQHEIDRIRSQNEMPVECVVNTSDSLPLYEFLMYNYYEWTYRMILNTYQSDKGELIERFRKIHNL